MDDAKIKSLKEELATQFDSYGFNKGAKDISKHEKGKADDTAELTAQFDNVLSAKMNGSPVLMHLSTRLSLYWIKT